MIILVVPKEMEKRKRNGKKANHRMIKQIHVVPSTSFIKGLE